MLKNLDEHEIESVSAEMAKLTVVSHELRQEILKEFTDIALQASAFSPRRSGQLRPRRSRKIRRPLPRLRHLGRVAPAQIPIAAMRQIIDMDCRQLFNLVKNEQPQTIALLVSFLSTEKSSNLLTLFKPEARDQVVERLATLGATPVEVVERIVEVLIQKNKVKSTRALNQTGGVKNAADVLNSLEKDISNTVLMDLERRNPELTMAIRQKMFTFEDLGMLDKTSLQKIMREVDTRDLAVALKGAASNCGKLCWEAFPNAPPKPSTRKSPSSARSRKRISKPRNCGLLTASANWKAREKLNSPPSRMPHAMKPWLKQIRFTQEPRDIRAPGKNGNGRRTPILPPPRQPCPGRI